MGALTWSHVGQRSADCGHVSCVEKRVGSRMSLLRIQPKLLPFLVALPPPRKTRAELMKAIDFEYYGYLDEDDGVIVPLEQEYEKKRMSMSVSL